MISILRGELIHFDEQRLKVVVDISGVGYETTIHLRDLSRLQSCLNQKIELFCYLHVREDVMELFGFLDRREKFCFIDLISVNGIGPRLGMTILGLCKISDLVQAVLIENKVFFKSIPGVGPKMAQRIILELQNKVKKWPTSEQILGEKNPALPKLRQESDDLRSTFINLGYPSLQIERVFMECSREKAFDTLPFEEKVREMLKKLSLKTPTQSL